MPSTSHRVLPLVTLLTLAIAGTAHADPRAELIAAFRNAVADKDYRLHIEVDGKRPVTSQLDVQLPDRFHMRAEGSEFIIVPEGTWINAGGQWMRMPVDMSQQIKGYALDEAEKGLADIDEVTRLGTESVDGCEATLYGYTARSGVGGRRSEEQLEVAVCERTGKPIRMRTQPKGKGDKVTIRYDFDAQIDIRPPR